ncbi:DUF6049 family protein [Nonomuraea sp. NPDC050556]|uniref:DUF6049 family protein n=1 Tax=Nonomuraea sp. NPDC050556 TaxID=3364369 RepID=UPI0037A77432
MIGKATLVALLSAALLAPVVATTAGTAAATRVSRDTTRLTVQSITPEIPTGPTQELKLSGTFKNGTGAPLSTVQVRLRPSSSPLLGRTEMAAYLQGGPVSDYASQTSVMDIPVVETGGQVSWTLTATPVQLRMTNFGVYPLGVEVVANGVSVAVQHTVVTYAPETMPKLPRNKLAVALPVIDKRPPHRAADDTFLDDDLRADLTGEGRLADLLKIAETAPKSVTWFVDPSLFDDVTASTTAVPEAAKWISGMKEALSDSPVVALPYADPDIAALAHQGLDEQTGKAIELGGKQARTTIKADASTKAYWPVDGMIDADGLDLLGIGKVDTVLLNPDNLPLDPTVTTTPDASTTLDTVAGPVTALVADKALSQAFELDSTTTPALNKQRFIAETALIAAEPGQTKPKTLVVAPSRRWNPNPAFVSSLLKVAGTLPWLSMTDLASVKPSKTPALRGELTYPEQNREKELGKKYLDRVRKVANQAKLTTQITTKRVSGNWDAAVLRLTSSAWRNRLTAARAATAKVGDKLGDSIDQVSVPGHDQVRTLAGSEGVVPISVRNKSNQDIIVKVEVTSNNPDVLKIGKIENNPTNELRIGAKQNGTLQLPVVATSSGDASVTVQLKTRDGLKYDDPVKLTVRTTGYTGIALVIVGAALTVMLAAVVTRVLRRRSQRRAARPVRVRESEPV